MIESILREDAPEVIAATEAVAEEDIDEVGVEIEGDLDLMNAEVGDEVDLRIDTILMLFIEL